MVERAGRADDGRPDLGRITHVEGPRSVGVGRRSGPGLAALEPDEVGRQPVGQRARVSPQAGAEHAGTPGRDEKLGGRQQLHRIGRADRPLVGRVEHPDLVDLVAEQLDPDRELRAGGEDVDKPAATGHLPPAGNLENGLVAEAKELGEQVALADAVASAQDARPRRQVLGEDRGLEKGLDRGHQDADGPTPPSCQRRHPGRGFVADQLAALEGERAPWLQHRDGARIAKPRHELVRDAVADLGVAGDPAGALPIGTREGGHEV